MDKLCKNCNFGKLLYRDLSHIFRIHEDPYLCEFKQEITDPCKTCPEWQRKKRRTADLSKSRFDKAEEDLKAIFKYL